ncbi:MULTISPECIES: winged helix-turn-helix domain-containing protein [Rhodomicrobium]|uniref:winged helix-turn-helix domain-containing protein n=1 Tax=Rhodomicrobium TaxID=1068 RepID=UPI000B4AB854|nr:MULTISPECIES: winged helix-turn-helix domain-containing protein [Rhodomicrobium]
MAPVSGKQPRLAVVSGDAGMRQTIIDCLQRYDLSADWGASREDLDRIVREGEPRLIILDAQLGARSGFDLLRDIRRASNVPVIMVAADRRNETERIIGLELGADDYVTKPFSLRELMARVRAVLRRHESRSPKSEHTALTRGYQFEGWRADRKTRRLTDPAGNHVRLTRAEFALLLAFLDAPQRMLTRDQLLGATSMHEGVYDRSIDVRVLRLRRKLGDDPVKPHFILTERGIGYSFGVPVEVY